MSKLEDLRNSLERRISALQAQRAGLHFLKTGASYVQISIEQSHEKVISALYKSDLEKDTILGALIFIQECAVQRAKEEAEKAKAELIEAINEATAEPPEPAEPELTQLGQ